MWLPVSMHQWARPAGDFWFETRRALLMNVIARLRPGVSMSEAQAQMRTIAKQLEQAYPDVNKERSIALMSLEAAKSQGLAGPGNEDLARNVSLLLLVASASILLIACANVANLLLARATTRQREMAVRLALGAGRGRIVRQLLTESVLLGLIGGAGGVLLAYCLGDVLIALLPPTPFPIALNPRPDWRVLLFSFVMAILSGIIFGLAPALQMARWNLTQGLRERASTAGGAVTRFNLRSALVVAQIAVSLLLLIASGLFLKSFYKAQAIDPGFRTENLDIVTINPVLAGYDSDRAVQVTRSDRRANQKRSTNCRGRFEQLDPAVWRRRAHHRHRWSRRQRRTQSPIRKLQSDHAWLFPRPWASSFYAAVTLTEHDAEKNAAPVADH